MVLQKDCLLTLKKVQYLFGGQGRGIDAGRVGRFESLHQSDLFIDALFTDVAVLFGVEPTFVVKQRDVSFADNTFWVLSVPFSGSVEQEVKVEGLQLFGISEVGFELLDEVVPEQQSVPVKKPGETHVGEGAQPRHKTSVLSLHLKIDEVPQLQNGVSGAKKTVVGPHFASGQNGGDGVFIFGFFDRKYEPFDDSTFVFY